MATEREELLLSIETYRKLGSPQFSDGTVSGYLEKTAENCTLVTKLDTLDLLYPTNDFAQPSPGQKARIEFHPPRKPEAFFARDIDDLLARNFASHQPPEALYLADRDESYVDPAQAPAGFISQYLQVVRAAQLLKLVSDHDDTANGYLRVVFLHKEKLEVILKIDPESIRPLDKLDDWDRLLREDTHREQRRTIFKSVLHDELRGIDVGGRFNKFLNRFEELFRRFLDNYHLYVSEFSFEKVLGEINEKKIEYVIKLNKTFSDIQNQLLAIPVAVVLVGGQLEQAGSITVKNTVILAGALIFAVLMSLLLKNQRDSLNATYSEISSQKEKLKKKHAALADQFDKAYEDLDERYEKQKRLLCIVDGLVAASLFGTVWLFGRYSGLFNFICLAS